MRKLRSLFVIIFSLINLTTTYGEDKPVEPFTLSSTASAEQGGALPVLYTCDGKNISPAVSWSGVPKGTKSFVLIVSDPDAPNGVFYHWILFNLPKDTRTLPEGIDNPPAGSGVGINSWGKTNYGGPCPPKDTSHHYNFALYALDTKLKLREGADAEAVKAAIKKHVLGTAEFVAVYTRWVD